MQWNFYTNPIGGKTKENFLAWWANEDFGRCGIAVTAPKEGLQPLMPPQLPEKVEDRWLDFDYLKQVNEYRMSRTFYGGEAIPIWHPGYPGWDFIPSYLGAKVDLAEETGWVHPILETGELTDYDYHDIGIKPDNQWWVFAEKMHKFAAEEAKGKSLAGIQAIGGSGDILAGLRSTGQLLMDVLDCPEYVREFELHLMKIWIEVYDKFYGIINKVAEGSTGWFPLWAPGRFYPVQNDFSYMISPQMFRDIFLPAIEVQTEHLDYSLYHLDGVEAFAHLEALCELPKLQAFQVQPGAGKPNPLHYMDILKKVQRAGKNLHITIPCNEVETALENLSSRGLFIDTSCQTEEEAKYLLKNLEKWSKVRKV